MVLEEQDRLVAQRRGDPLALVARQGEAAIAVVVGDPAPEPGAILVDRQHAAVLEAGEGGGVGHVRVQDAADFRAQAMQRAVDAPGGRVGRVGPVHHRGIVDIQQEQVAGGDPGEMTPARIDQDAAATGVEGQAEMVGHRLMPAEPCGEPECGGKIDPRLPIAYGRELVTLAISCPRRSPCREPQDRGNRTAGEGVPMRQPNILMIMADQLSALALPCLRPSRGQYAAPGRGWPPRAWCSRTPTATARSARRRARR